MNIVRATHQLAMDMSTLAGVSKAKGFHHDAKDFYVKAFELEKKAALMTSNKDKDPVPHFILMRSAAALAYKAGLYNESAKLIEMCLAEHPPKWIVEELNDISNLIEEARSSKDDREYHLEIEGVLTKVSSDENEIMIKDVHQDQSYVIIVPKNLLVDIIKKYWFQKVLINVRQTNQGIMVLEGIKSAA